MFKKVSIALLLSSLPLAAIAQKGANTPTKPLVSCLEAYKQKHYQKAFPLCQHAAQNNDATAQTILGLLSHRGQGIPRDDRQALLWLEKAATADVAAAQFYLARLYSMNVITQGDDNKAFDYYLKAANQKFPPAQLMVALCYQNGYGVKKDFNQALEWYAKAQQNGLQHAPLITLENVRHEDNALIFETSAQQDYETALSLAKLNDPEENESYFALLQQAAQKGHPQAEYQLALEFLKGEKITQDDAKAIEWLQRAADKNHQDAQSQLAWMAALGLGMEEDLTEAIKWFTTARTLTPVDHIQLDAALSELTTDPAAEDVIMPKKASAQFNKGMAYFEAQMEEGDLQKGLKLISSAAAKDLPQAQSFLADLYQEGIAVKQNPKLAFAYYEKAAKNGDAHAQYELGWLYAQGIGTEQSLPKAFEWLDRASKNGHAKAETSKNFIRVQMANLADTPRIQSAKEFSDLQKGFLARKHMMQEKLATAKAQMLKKAQLAEKVKQAKEAKIAKVEKPKVKKVSKLAQLSKRKPNVKKTEKSTVTIAQKGGNLKQRLFGQKAKSSDKAKSVAKAEAKLAKLDKKLEKAPVVAAHKGRSLKERFFGKKVKSADKATKVALKPQKPAKIKVAKQEKAVTQKQSGLKTFFAKNKQRSVVETAQTKNTETIGLKAVMREKRVKDMRGAIVDLATAKPADPKPVKQEEAKPRYGKNDMATDNDMFW